MKLILASKSPRRSEILKNLGVSFRVVTADTDESSDWKNPAALVEELALRKAEAVWKKLSDAGEDLHDVAVLASDTVVFAEGEILGKPRNEADARRMLRLLSGKTHEVVSGVALCHADRKGVSHEVTRVKFAPLTEENISFYLRSGEPFDKAGAYAVQGLASLWIEGLEGDYFSVVGLPVHRLNLLWQEIFGGNFIESIDSSL